MPTNPQTKQQTLSASLEVFMNQLFTGTILQKLSPILIYKKQYYDRQTERWTEKDLPEKKSVAYAALAVLHAESRDKNCNMNAVHNHFIKSVKSISETLVKQYTT